MWPGQEPGEHLGCLRGALTPFVEMTALIEADVIEPWDNFIPKTC
ncbi:MAG: hypothetical protein R2856_25165 [Caldilineaceae bacterium]